MRKQINLVKESYVDFTHKASRDINTIKRIFTDILEQVDSYCYPFLILCEQLPQKILLEDTMAQLAKRGIYPCDTVMVLCDNSNQNNSTIWEILKTGIKDIYNWAGEDDFKNYIIHTIQRRQKVTAILQSALVKDNLIGESVAWKNFLYQVIEAVLFSQCSFLLMGASGTGKELISRLIHTIDNRADKKELVLVDCTTIVPELSGSEFFGHERGSYTNAMQSREGAFSLANKGTLFLDEIGELQLPLQAELLRVIQEGTYKKIGSNQWQKTVFRLVCATHRNIRKQVEEHKFRQDLFFRISDVELQVPTLADRKEDIPLLANYFLQQFTKEEELPRFDDNIMEFLVHRHYPGNVRELRQLLQRIALRHVRHKKITIGELPIEEREQHKETGVLPQNHSLDNIVRQMILNGENYNSVKDKVGTAAIVAAIELNSGNKQKAAALLGVDVRTVQLSVKKKV